MTSIGILAVIVFFAYGIEAALGFGCTILAVTLAVHMYELSVLLPVLVFQQHQYLEVRSWRSCTVRR